MPKFDATINGISLASYGVEPNMATVPQPEAKTYQAEIPGRDGLLDYTDAYGVVRYENRTVTVEAYEIGDITARMEHRRAVCSDMHGKTCTLALTTLPGYTFTGRCSVEYDEDGSETDYKLSFDCQPYMSAGERTFVGNCAGGVDLVFVSGDKPVKPRIEVPRRSIIIFNGQQYEVEAGTWTFDGVVFKRGRNELYINTYTEPGTTTWGDLESMTWEQIGWHHRQSEASGELVNVTDALQARPSKLVVDGKCQQTVGVWGTNLVTNGDFSDGTTGWAGINGDSIVADNGTLKIYGNTGNQHKWCTQSNKNIPVGHKVYVRWSVKTDSAAVIMQGRFTLLTSSFTAAAPNTATTLSTNVWGTVSGVVETTAEVSIIALGGTFETQAIAIAANVWVDNILVIDLTAAFGAGNEPTAEQMDAYLAAYPNSWFDGSALLTTDGTPNSPSPEYPKEVDVVDSPVSVQVVGKNLLRYPYADSTKTTRGITFTSNGDGSVSVSGTATGTAYFNFIYSNPLLLAQGTYKFSVNTLGGARIVLKKSDGATLGQIFGTQTETSIVIGAGEGIYDGYIAVDAGTVVNATIYPQLEYGSAVTPYEPYASSQQTITLPPDHNYLASLPDGTHDELVLRSDGVAVLVERISKLASYNGEPITTSYMSTTGQLTTGATIYYATDETTVYSADNGSTWSTTEPARGLSVIQLHKGTNNVWCTDALSPTITLNYDTQERTRKQRVSELYWRNNPPQRRLTWGQLSTNTWAEIGSKPVQEWYYSGTADVVENAYINYEIGDL